MSKVYFPLRYIDVPASPPHDDNQFYRVSFGIEHWTDGSAEHVYKIQMVYDGVVAGRKSPSFPDGTNDLDHVIAAIKEVKAGKGERGRGQMSSIGE